MSAATWVIDALPAGCDDFGDGALVSLGGAADEDQRGVAPGELLGGGVAETRRGAGDDDDPTGQVVVVERRPARPAVGGPRSRSG